MQKVEIIFAEDGTIKFMDDGTTSKLFENAEVKRVSHVEPVNIVLRKAFHVLRTAFGEYGWMATFTRSWRCVWRVNLSPIGHGILYTTYTNRADAIAAEIEYVNAHYL